ncbi:MAG: hypothetical protein AB8H79_22715 [Myxococcota bacterium]
MTIAYCAVAIALIMVVGACLVAILAGFRLLTGGRTLSGGLAIGSGLFLSSATVLMPLELSLFASLDNNRPPLDLLMDVATEPWFLVAWAVLMIMAAVPNLLFGLALWFATPREAIGALGSDHS